MTDLQRPTGATPSDPAPATAEPEPEAGAANAIGGVGAFFGDLKSDLGGLIRKEVELALAETREELMQAAKAGGMLGAGALSGFFAALFGSLTLAWFLDRKLPRWLAFGLVAALHGAAAGTLLAKGREEMLQVDPVPHQTMESLKDDVDAIRSAT